MANPSPMPQQEPMGGGFPMNNDPMANPGGEAPMEPGNAPQDMGGNMEPENSGSEIDSIYNQLSPDDQKAAKKYAESLLNRDEEAKANMGNEMSQNGQEPPMQEVFHKVNGRLVREDCGTGLDNACNDSECNSNKKLPKKKVATRTKSPFSSPLKK